MNYLTSIHTDAGIRKDRNQDSVLIETAATDYGQILLSVVTVWAALQKARLPAPC